MNDQDLPESGATTMTAVPADDDTTNGTVVMDQATQNEDLSQTGAPITVDKAVFDDEEMSDDDEALDEDGDDSLIEEMLDTDDLDQAEKERRYQATVQKMFELDPLDEQISELDVLTLEGAAQYLQIEYGMVRRLVKEQGLPGRKIGSEMRFLRGAIADWLRGSDEATPAASSEKPARKERIERAAREDRPAREDRLAREDRPRRRFSEEGVGNEMGDEFQSRPPRKRPQFRSESAFGGGYQGGQEFGGGSQGSYPPPRRRRYEDEQAPQQFASENQHVRRKRPFRETEGGQQQFDGGQQFGGGYAGGPRRFGAGPKKPKRQTLTNQRFKRLDRRRFGGDDAGQDE